MRDVTPVLFISTIRVALAWTKRKHLLRNEKLKANRASETEEQMKERQRKERLSIRRENEKIENHEKQRLATLKRLKRRDDNELKRNLRLRPRLAVETEQERRTRLENDAAILCLSFKLDDLST